MSMMIAFDLDWNSVIHGFVVVVVVVILKSVEVVCIAGMGSERPIRIVIP